MIDDTAAAVITLVMGSAVVQLAVVAGGAIGGLLFCRTVEPGRHSRLRMGHGTKTGVILLALFAILLLGLPFMAQLAGGPVPVADAFYRAGALVFGGGHVVLPLLEEYVVKTGWVSQDQFLAGYGAAQAVPGPMFSFSAYLGLVLFDGAGGIPGSIVALLSIFLPGFLLVAGILPFWQRVSEGRRSAQAIAGVNAAVVGLLGAALYDPIFITAIRGPVDLAIGLVAFLMLASFRLSALSVVAWCVLAGIGQVFL